MLAVSILALALSGCKDSSEAMGKSEPQMEIWEAPDGSYTIPLNENEWKVEEESNGELHFLNNKNEKFSFSISKWEKLQFPDSDDTLCFVAIYPAENSKEQEEEFKKIVTGIRFDLEKE